MRAKLFRRPLVLLAALALLAVACTPAAAPAKPAAPPAAKPAESKPAARQSVTLKALSVWEKPISYATPLVMFIERIQQKTGGELQIEFTGPEVVPPFEQMTAVSRGAFDIAHTSPAFYGTNLPESNALYFTVGTCDKYRPAGVMDIIDEAHRQKTNTTMIGCSGGGHGFVFLTRDPVQSLDYFRGKKMRTTDMYTPILNALGSSPVQVAPAEVYTALERRVVDGMAWPEAGIMERKVHEVLKYMITPTWLEVRESTVMNLNSFNRLPPHLQKALVDTFREMEPEFDDFFRQAARKEQEELQREGVQIVRLPEPEASKLLELVDEALWSKIERDSPDFARKLREALATVPKT